MKVRDLIKLLQKHRPDSGVTFSVELPESEDPTERRFAEDGWQFVHGNGCKLIDCRDETKVTIGVLCGPSNLASGREIVQLEAMDDSQLVAKGLELARGVEGTRQRQLAEQQKQELRSVSQS
jgi:hypothetical protein